MPQNSALSATSRVRAYSVQTRGASITSLDLEVEHGQDELQDTVIRSRWRPKTSEIEFKVGRLGLRIAQEREEGIRRAEKLAKAAARRIQSQVHEVNQIFRDLVPSALAGLETLEASIVHEQGNDIESIEHSADTAARESKQVGIRSLRNARERAENPRFHPFFTTTSHSERHPLSCGRRRIGSAGGLPSPKAHVRSWIHI